VPGFGGSIPDWHQNLVGILALAGIVTGTTTKRIFWEIIPLFGGHIETISTKTSIAISQ